MLLQEMSKAFSEGDFEGSWRSLRRFFESAPPDEMERLMSAHCWGGQRATLVAVCPRVDFLAWATGQTAADFGFVDRLCEVRRDEPDGLAWRAGWSCDQLVLLITKRRQVLSSSSPPLRSGRMGMRLLRPDRSDARRVVIAGWEHGTFWALLDTGASSTFIPRTALAWGGDRVERLGTSVAITRFDGVARNREQVLLREFGGPGMAQGDLPATVAPASKPYGAIGMNALSRFEAVCFSWRDEVLHLGELGPCGEGTRPHRAWLSGNLTPVVAIDRAEAAKVRVLIDTGARATLCAEGVARADAGELRFGDHPDMVLSCAHELPPEFGGPPESGGWLRYASVLAGMDLLTRFDAFGWRLNPFEMYFLPKRERDVASVGSGA